MGRAFGSFLLTWLLEKQPHSDDFELNISPLKLCSMHCGGVELSGSAAGRQWGRIMGYVLQPRPSVVLAPEVPHEEFGPSSKEGL